jgi:hypothetical protein
MTHGISRHQTFYTRQTAKAAENILICWFQDNLCAVCVWFRVRLLYIGFIRLRFRLAQNPVGFCSIRFWFVPYPVGFCSIRFWFVPYPAGFCSIRFWFVPYPAGFCSIRFRFALYPAGYGRLLKRIFPWYGRIRGKWGGDLTLRTGVPAYRRSGAA